MAIYNLEENPDIFITPQYYGNEFEYAMVRITDEGSTTTVRVIDLRNEKLIVYGTQIEKCSLKRLYESLVIRSNVGIMYYNCDGACYLRIHGKGVYRPIHNVIFDWSAFGVVVPNSVNGSLRNQLELKEKVIDQLNEKVSSSEAEMESTKASLKSSMDEIEKLKEQLSTSKHEQEEMEVKLQEVCHRLALLDFELELNKIELESYKRDEEELIDQLCSYKEKSRNVELELQKLQDQLSSVNCELQSSKIELQSSTRSIKEFEKKLSSCRKENQELERKHQRVEKQNSSIRFELGTTKKEQQHMEVELQKAFDHLCIIDHELMSTNQKLSQVFESKIWAEVDNCHTNYQASQQCPLSNSSLAKRYLSLSQEEYDISILFTI